MYEFEHEDEIYLIIRQNIKTYRTAQKITSAELAERVGLSHEFIRALESSNPKFTMSVRTLYKIAIALDVSVDVLMGTQNDDVNNENEPTK